MKKKIWIINHYAGSMLFDKGGRHYWIAKYLNLEGYNVSVLCCNTKHNGNRDVFINTNDLYIEKKAEEINTKFIYIKSNVYKGNGIDRIFNMIQFYINVQKVAHLKIKKSERPDVIIASSAHPLSLVAGIKIGRKYGIPCICEVRDLWPASIVAYNSYYKESNVLIKLLYKGERWIYEHADALIFTISGGAKYISEKGWDIKHGGKVNLNKVYYINNGVDLDEYNKQLVNNTLKDTDLDSPDFKKIIYTGSIGRANNIDRIVEIAKVLDKEMHNVKVLVYGDGTEKERLEQYAKEEKISSIVFKGKVDKRFIPYILSKGQLNILDSFNDEICKYGISSNKLFEYIASGNPIITDSKYDIDIISKNQIGVVRPFSSIREECDVIMEMLSNSNKYTKNINSVIRQYDFKTLTNQIVTIISTVCNE